MQALIKSAVNLWHISSPNFRAFQPQAFSPISLFQTNTALYHEKANRKYATRFRNWKIVQGDTIAVITGKDRGKQGKVLKVYRKTNMVLVSDINQKLKRVKGDPEKGLKGGVKPIIKPVHVSNVMLVDPELGKPTRVRFGYLESGEKIRISKKTGSVIKKPMLEKYSRKFRIKDKVDGLKDTPSSQVLEVTYKGENFDKIKQEFEAYIKAKEAREKLLVFDE